MIAILFEVGLFALLLFIDLLSKGLIMPFLLENSLNVPLIDGVLELTYAENYGASFGIFQGKTGLLIATTVITILLLVGVLVLMDNKPRLLRYGLVTIVAGAFGNLVDRIAFGYVRDFIDYAFFETWFNWNFAIGNIADIFCIVGVLEMIVYLLFEYKEGDLGWRFKNFRLCKKTK